MSTPPEDNSALPRFAFGDSPELADELAALVVAGRKTATSMTPDHPNRPEPGQRWIVVDGRGEPACVIETLSVVVCRFDEVGADFAAAEGEGDGSLETWRRNHEAYFGRLGRFRGDMTVACERFRLIETFGRTGATR